MNKRIKEYITIFICSTVAFFVIQFFSDNDRDLIEVLCRTGILAILMAVALFVLAFIFTKIEARKKDK